MKKQFGTDGVRGKANEKLNPSLAYHIGLALVKVLKEYKKNGEKPEIIVGRDTRLSGTMLLSGLAAGVTAAGGNLKDLGIIPTPAVSFYVRHIKADAGVVISASHNPFDDNGIKIFGADGKKFPDAMEEKIEYILAEENWPVLCIDAEIGELIPCDDGRDVYLNRLKKLFDLDLTGYKILLDTANGATSDYAPALFRSLGADVVQINGQYNGVNINLDCGSTKPGMMAKAVVEQKADIGFAYDGDGDRLIMADASGNIVDGDQAMAIMALELKKQGKLSENRLVVTVMSNLGLRLAMKEAGIDISITTVGDKNVMVEMDRTGGCLGGEQSGHLILSEYNPTGDGILSSLMIAKIMKDTGKSLEELASVMTVLPQVLKNITVKNRDGWQDNPGVQKEIKKAENILGDKGRILVRPSGTEPLLRVMGEGPDSDELERIVQNIVDVMIRELND